MRTDDLINLLASNANVEKTDSATRRFAWALGIGIVITALLMKTTLGINPALVHYFSLSMFWVKALFVATLAGIGLIAALRLSRPGVDLGRVPAALAIPVAAMWAIAIVVLVPATPAERAAAFFGRTWAVCPLLIAMLSVPVFAGIIWAMKGLAPTRLRMAGAAAGFLSGAVGALVYCLHCPELGPPFIGFWYLLGILIPTGIGTLLGNRLLQW